MNSRVHKIDRSSVIETHFKENLTGYSCTILITELIKYILYHKQQLPYTFDRLKYLITKRKSAEGTTKLIGNSKYEKAIAERLFKVAEDALAALEVLFDITGQELSDFTKGKICEFAVLFGGSPLTPKQVYRIHVPDVRLSLMHSDMQEKNKLLSLLQCILRSTELTDMLAKPMNPTNMFVLVRKYGEIDGMNKSFFPKHRYKLPTCGQHFHIKFQQPSKGFSIFCDDSENDTSDIRDNELVKQDHVETEWYQACATFHGFKDVFVNGISASELWLRNGPS